MRFTAAEEQSGSGVEGSETSEGSVAPERFDALLDAFADPRRRLVVEYVRDNGTATLSELAEHVADSESPDRPRVEAVETELYHAHLPRLVDADLLAYDDDDRKTVRADDLSDVTALLE